MISKKVAIYIRVSTQEQAQEGYSVQAQRDRLINYCKARDWVIQDIYVDPGFSGSNLDRPGMQKLISNIHDIDLVLVYKLDRLSRSQKDTLYLIEDVFISNNVDFVSMNESFDTSTPFGRAMVGILSVFAQLEREQIKERSLMGRMERAKDGLYHGGWNTPIGYRYIPAEDALVIDDYEAMQVKKIYELYLSGKSICDIRKFMHNNGYTTQFGSYAHAKTISNILSAPVYTGKIVFRDNMYDGKHEPIINQNDFDAVQKRLDSRKTLSFKQRPSKALLTGMIYCEKCGARYNYKHNSGNYFYYGCYSRTKSQSSMIKDKNCKNRHWKIDELDTYVEQYIFTIASSKKHVEKLFKDSQKSSLSKSEYNSLIKQVKTIEKQINKLMELYSIDTIPIADLSKKIDELYGEKKKIENHVSKYNKVESLDQYRINTVWKMVKGLRESWHNMDREEKRELLQSLISRIDLNDSEVMITWAFL